MQDQSCWNRFVDGYQEFPAIALALDHSRVTLPENYFRRRDVQARAKRAFAAMAKLEKGTLANPDEQRMVGHYWLRNAGLAPTPGLKREIEQTVRRVKKFAAEVNSGKVRGRGGKFANLLVIGIGGSALGPQFVANALGHPQTDRLQPFFFDNTDPDGMDKVLAQLEGRLGRTLCVVISKSGTTPETYNGMIEARAAYDAAELTFARHAVAITQDTSKLGQQAQAEKWLSRFPMWDWVGGRTSETSVVGLLPAALQGFAIDRLLAGAGACDDLTRVPDLMKNPAALLAELWYFLGEGRGGKDMVVIPYKDRLDLLSKYLQQLVMESLGKEKDLEGRVVNQGL
ncbi:MAG: glucose-6-phosphate isomerase, partial [Limisphaerales bacterium]